MQVVSANPTKNYLPRLRSDYTNRFYFGNNKYEMSKQGNEEKFSQDIREVSKIINSQNNELDRYILTLFIEAAIANYVLASIDNLIDKKLQSAFYKSF